MYERGRREIGPRERSNGLRNTFSTAIFRGACLLCLLRSRTTQLFITAATNCKNRWKVRTDETAALAPLPFFPLSIRPHFLTLKSTPWKCVRINDENNFNPTDVKSAKKFDCFLSTRCKMFFLKLLIELFCLARPCLSCLILTAVKRILYANYSL